MLIDKPLISILLSPELFPSVGMMALVKSADEVWLEYHDHFPKQTLRNRYYILTAQGIIGLTVPVQKASKLLSHQVKVSYEQNWPKQHYETLAAAYGKSAYWIHYEGILRQWLETPYQYLSEMQQGSLTICLNSLSLKPELLPIRQTLAYMAGDSNLANTIDGRDLITKTSFTTLPHLPIYDQCFSIVQDQKVGAVATRGAEPTFIAGLSLIDLLFCTGPTASDFVPKYNFLSNLS